MNNLNQPADTPGGDAQDEVIRGHNYDGIKEYDNPMPGWWIYIFWATVIFAPIYILGITVFDYIDTYEDDLSQGQAELVALREAYEQANPSFTPDEASIAAFVGDAAREAAGEATYGQYCAACHGQVGQGLIGPNLTDDYWIHGADNLAMFNIITDGVPAKGMTPWGSILTPEQRAELIAYIHTLQGTNPPDAKAPEGDLVSS